MIFLTPGRLAYVVVPHSAWTDELDSPHNFVDLNENDVVLILKRARAVQQEWHCLHNGRKIVCRDLYLQML